MIRAGLIANPQSGKDIRRLVAHASVFDNHEKVNIVRRILIGLEAVGVNEVQMMPDYFGIGPRALHGLSLAMPVRMLELPLDNTLDDSTRAADLMRAAGVGVIVTLGGDGTNRAVAKTCGDVPIVAISTGTNNVFPEFVEGTVAGMAAGLVARGLAGADTVSPTLRVEVWREDRMVDLALIDAVVYDAPAVGTRAIWDAAGLRQILLTRVEPDRIGLSAIGSALGVTLGRREGLYLETAAPNSTGRTVTAAIGPGLIRDIGISGQRTLAIGDSIAVNHAPAVIALDGERMIVTRPADAYTLRLADAGPRVVDVRAALAHAAARGFFIRGAGERRA